MDYTSVAKKIFIPQAERTDSWGEQLESIQRGMLRSLLRRGADCEAGRAYRARQLARLDDPYPDFAKIVPMVAYDDIRSKVMRMIDGEKDVLWPGQCRSFAQSSGTSGGRSKYIPVTDTNLQRGHYRGSSYCVAHYLRHRPDSKLFSGKGFILGGSFSSKIQPKDPRVHIGDLSATLIDRINPLVNLFRVPDKKTALIADWSRKLPALVAASRNQNITNMSGVPSWFLTVLREVMKSKGVSRISDVWPNLEVFFHGGISFQPYRQEYEAITDPKRMRFVETYNASEGFFGVQDDPDDSAMMLIIDNDVFYEFIPVDDPASGPRPAWDLEKDRVYEMLITSSNGLWRYRLGDTVRVCSTHPLKIKIAGRTKCYINAFGEELMEENAERAMAEVSAAMGLTVLNYTAAPVFAAKGKRGHHQWIVEWAEAPTDTKPFAMELDAALRRLNSDYDAKRAGTIFLDPPEVISAPRGTFDRWLKASGNHKLGGQRKVPRLANDRKLVETILELMQ